MRKFLRLFVALCLMTFLLPPNLIAQERTVTGTVVSDDNKSPLQGVTVRVKGSKRFTQTDANGKFSIKMNPGETLQISYVGYEASDVKPGDGNVVAVNLKQADAALGEVVVTAMDIKRNPRELGYSVQKVSGDDIKETQRENFLNSLQGRVAGLTVNPTSGIAGSSSSIVLRGFNSLSMSNQPLFVIDGIIVDNQTIDENSDGGKGVGMIDRSGLTNNANRTSDYSNRISDINPNDIETITVLKGPEATALYGSQASSGAIVITTRKAKTNKLAIQYDNNFRFQKATRLPEFFDGYSNGTNGTPSNQFRYFGPAYPAGTQLYDNMDYFFKTGFAQTHNLGLDFGFKNSVFRVSAFYFDQDGIIPNNTLTKYNFRISNTTKVGKMLEFIPSIAYIRTENDKALRGTAGYLLSLAVWPNNRDIRNFEDINGDKLVLFNANPNSDFDNPLFNVKKNRSRDETDRYTASLGVNFNPLDWLSISGRFGYDAYDMVGYLRYHPQSFYLSAGQGGLQDNYWRKYSGYNHTITATARKKVGDFNLRLMGGTMWQDNTTKMFTVSGTNIVDSVVAGKMWKNGVIITDKQLSETLPQPSDSNATRLNTRTRLLRNGFNEYNRSVLKQIAYFGEFAVNWKNMIFLTYSHRFESSSTLPAKNRNYNYPAGSLSVMMSDLVPSLKKGNTLTYWKLRTSIASTARLNTPYSTQSVYVNAQASGGGNSYGFTNANDELKPERQKTFEIGTEFRLLKSRLGIDVTYYNTLNKDQIIENFRLSYATGYVLNTQNAGSTRNKGVEIVLNGNIIKKSDFTWDMAINFNRMWNKVIEMPANLSEYYIADTWVFGEARGGLMLNNPTTTITSYGYARNNAGKILINAATGLPVIDASYKIRGDRNPDFTIGWNNSFRYGNFKLTFLWDLKVGGDIFNGTNMYLTSVGRSMYTADRFTPIVLDGVLQDGKENSATPTVNTISFIPAYNDAYYNQVSTNTTYAPRNIPEEAFIEKDVNWFRLRDLTLSYNFPQKFTGRIKAIKSLGVFMTGNDLILLTNYSGPDPSVNANTAGSRGVGGFGFDFFTLGTPVSVSFGLKASF